MNNNFSVIILTLNEEIHLPRLLDSLKGLNANTFVLDSGSSDGTLHICARRHIEIAFHAFKDHPSQWDYAINHFSITTPWIVALDADQILSENLYNRLKNFDDRNFVDVDGIYFNRKNFFKGRWIKHGGYYPKFLLKMFRSGRGYSDLSESFDHRFQVPGKTLIWKDGILLEENLKENHISFWINKHNIYSDLAAKRHLETKKKLSCFHLKYLISGQPNQKTALLKSIWFHLPIYIRPFLYFGYRLIILRGMLDGKNGIIFHFLQGFWFRMIVDIKIDELKSIHRKR